VNARNTLASFEHYYIPEPNSGCWIWLGPLLDQRPTKQYGRFQWFDPVLNKRAMKLAHVLSYELYIAAIPEGKELDHLCKNTWCVNPAHLEPVTHTENVRRSKSATKTHCRHGHPYSDGFEYYFRKDVGQGERYRRCLTCYRLKYPGTKKVDYCA